jgi:hypothetical protein
VVVPLPPLDETSRFDVESRASMIRSKKNLTVTICVFLSVYLNSRYLILIYQCVIVTEPYGNVKTPNLWKLRFKKKKWGSFF